MKMYRVRRYANTITEIEVERATEHFAVLPSGRRDALATRYDNIFASREEAHTFLLNRATDKVKRLRRDLELAEAELKTLAAGAGR